MTRNEIIAFMLGIALGAGETSRIVQQLVNDNGLTEQEIENMQNELHPLLDKARNTTPYKQ